LRASAVVQRSRLLGHIVPGAFGWNIRLGNYEMVGVGQLETGKVQAVWFPVFFLYCSGLVWN